MTRLIKLIEELLFPIIAIASLLVSLADLFGLFHLIPAGTVPMLTLLLVSLALNSLVVIQKRTNEILERTQLLLSGIAIEQMAKETIVQIDPCLRKVMQDDYFFDIVGFLSTAIKENKVPVNDIARLRYYYNRTLQCFPRAIFLSTNSVSAFSLWKDHAIEKATTDFIRNGGKMKQIFFVKKAQEHSLPATQTMIAHMQKMGVQLHVVNGADTTVDLKKNFIVESKGKIAWEVLVDDGEHVGSSILSANKNLTIGHCRAFEKLLKSEIRM